MNEDWKNPICKKCGRKYRIQDIHKCYDVKDFFSTIFGNKDEKNKGKN